MDKNYKLYRIHQHKIFDMICQVLENAPLNPDVLGMATEEEKEKYNKELNEYLNNKKPELIEEFIKMGFEVDCTGKPMENK